MSEQAPPLAPQPTQYSRAFDTLVEDPDDLVGLLAYALYKQTVRESVASGRTPLPPAQRHPAPTERAAYRGDAERRLQNFAAAATEEATPEIIARGVGIAIDAARIELTDTINRRTSFWTAIGINLAAWIITLAITVLLLLAVYLPNWQAASWSMSRQSRPRRPLQDRLRRRRLANASASGCLEAAAARS